MRSRGAEGTAIDTVIASGRENTRPMVGRTGLRALRRGDPVGATVAAKYLGYAAPLGRLLYLGEPPGEVRLAAREAAERAAGALRAGAAFAEVDAVARTHLRAHGLDSAYGIGHSCGTQEFGPPYFGPEAPGTMAAGYVLAVDIGIFDVPWGGFRIEDGYLITEDGAEPLTSVPRDLVVVA